MHIFFSFFVYLWWVFSEAPFLKVDDYSKIVRDSKSEILSISLNSQDQWRLPIKKREIDPRFIKSLIAIEDKRFYRHIGVDPLALCRSLFHWFKNGKVTSGGSTITMQVARMLEHRPRTLYSKVVEIIRALQLELKYSKEEILNIYLSLTPYGGNIHGIVTASLYYFGKEPNLLSPSEIAFLIAFPQSPTVYLKKSEKLLKARNALIHKLPIPEDIQNEALIDPLPLIKHPFPRLALHLSHKLYQKEQFEFETTLDKTIQINVENLLRKWQFKDQQNAAVLIINQKGEIIAYCGSRDFFNDSLEGKVDMIQSIRSPGSTLKPFIYAFAMDENILHPETLIDDKICNFSGYKPTNFKDVFHGVVTIRQALQQSLNIPAVAVLEKLGPQFFISKLFEKEIKLFFPSKSGYPSLPIALGGVGIKIVDLARLYNIFNNKGKISSITCLKNEHIQVQTELLSEKTTSLIVSILKDVPTPMLYVNQDHTHHAPLAFKTGTSYGYRDAFAVGVNGEYTVLVWMGKANGSPLHGQVGRTDAAPLLLQIFQTLLPLPKQPIADVLEDKKEEVFEKLRNFFHKKSVESRVDHVLIDFPALDTTFVFGAKIPIQIKNGKKPFSVFINGELIKNNLYDFKFLYTPPHQGFYDLLVIDHEGVSAATTFAVK